MKVLKFFIGLFFTILLILISYIAIDKKDYIDKFINSNESNVSNSIKINNEKDYVYDGTYSYDNKSTEYIIPNSTENTSINNEFNTPIIKEGKQYLKDIKVPFININTTEVKIINSSLLSLYTEYAKRFDKQNTIEVLTYYAYTNDNYISIVIEYGYQEKDILIPNYITYTFSKKDGSLIDFKNATTLFNNNSKLKSSIKKFITNNIPTELQNNALDNKDSYTASIEKFNELNNNNKVLFYISDNKFNIITTIYQFDGNNLPHSIEIK